jgi:hypothetical protein
LICAVFATVAVPPVTATRAAVDEDPPGRVAAELDRIGEAVSGH